MESLDILTEYPLWWVPICLLVGLATALTIYFRDRHLGPGRVRLRTFLGFIRSTVVSILAFLLLEPYLKEEFQDTQQPVVVVLQDNSSSTLGSDSLAEAREFRTGLIMELEEGLSENFDIESYTFDRTLQPSDDLDFQGKQTDIANALEEVRERNINRNIGAVVLLSDGIANIGRNPLYDAEESKYPIYTVALGDTTRKRDLVLDRVAHNRLAYLGNDFPIEVALRADRLNGKSTKLRVYGPDGQRKEETIQFSSSSDVQEIPLTLSANQVGRQRFDVELVPLEGERSEANNRRTIYVDVLDGRQRILLIHSGPHPDIAAIRTAIEGNENYEMEVVGVEDVPSVLLEYDLIILHGLPNAGSAMREVLSTSEADKLPLWFIASFDSDLDLLTKAYPGIGITERVIEQRTAARPSLNGSFGLFQVQDETLEFLRIVPPLELPFARFLGSNRSTTLFKQQIGTVGTEQDLWSFLELDGRKMSLLIGEGIWRWRISEFLEAESHSGFDALISQTVQYLANKEDKRRFKTYSEDRYDEDQSVVIEAEFYNESLEPINDPEVQVILRHEDGTELQKVMSRTNSGYRLDQGRLRPGSYSYDAELNWEGTTYTSSGAFLVEAIELEATDLTADHSLLFNMAERSGGLMVYPSAMDSLVRAVSQEDTIAPLVRTQEEETPWLSLPWLLGILLSLLALEWFLRKLNGAY